MGSCQQHTLPSHLLDGIEYGHEHVSVVVAELVLQDGRQALKPHASVHVACREWSEGAVCLPVVLQIGAERRGGESREDRVGQGLRVGEGSKGVEAGGDCPSTGKLTQTEAPHRHRTEGPW